MKKTLKKLLKKIYLRTFSSYVYDREKKLLREEVVGQAISVNYRHDVEAKFLRNLSDFSYLLDIGANTGFYSSILEDIVGSENLYLFEPIPLLSEYLENHFPNATVFNLALSDEKTKQILKIPCIDGRLYDTRATLSDTHVEVGQTSFEEIEVDLIPLDELENKFKLSLGGLIKIDVEGYELEVLRGAEKIIKKYKPLILIEIEQRHHDYSISTIFEKFNEFEYKGYYMNPLDFSLLTIEEFVLERDQNSEYFLKGDFIKYLNNFFFVHKSFSGEFFTNANAFLEFEKNFKELS